MPTPSKMNYNVFMSILAMDSYYRNKLDASILLPKYEAKIATATILKTELPNGSAEAGFYASAYRWNGETIISYRGTDFQPGTTVTEFFDSPAWKDISNGLGFGGYGERCDDP
jgi:hypothetical protein